MLKGNDFEGFYKTEDVDGVKKVKMQLSLKPFLCDFMVAEGDPETAIEKAKADIIYAMENLFYGDIAKMLYGLAARVQGTPAEKKVLELLHNLELNPDDFTFKELDDAPQGEKEKDPT